MSLDVAQEIILSDGENLSLATWQRLRELHGNSNKLASKLGRTDHYARKNRTAIERIHDDLRKVDEEIKRRMALTTFSFCGLTFHYQGEFETQTGKYETKEDVPKERRKDAVQVRKEPMYIQNMQTGERTPLGPVEVYWAIKERVFILSRTPSVGRYSNRFISPQEIHVTLHEMREYVGRGAIQTKLTDPCAPWKVLPDDPEGEVTP